MKIRYNGKKLSSYKQLRREIVKQNRDLLLYTEYKHDFAYYDALSNTYEVLA